MAVRCSGRLDENVATREQLWGIHLKVVNVSISEWVKGVGRIFFPYRKVVFDLWEVRHPLRLNAKGDVSRAISTAGLDAGPVFDLGQYQSNELVNELIGSATCQSCLGTVLVALPDPPLDDVLLHRRRLGEHASD